MTAPRRRRPRRLLNSHRRQPAQETRRPARRRPKTRPRGGRRIGQRGPRNLPRDATAPRSAPDAEGHQELGRDESSGPIRRKAVGVVRDGGFPIGRKKRRQAVGPHQIARAAYSRTIRPSFHDVVAASASVRAATPSSVVMRSLSRPASTANKRISFASAKMLPAKAGTGPAARTRCQRRGKTGDRWRSDRRLRQLPGREGRIKG
jgi:hypothetical protein